MSECIGCKFYDSSVDCCNADENCYQVGYEQGREDVKKECIKLVMEYFCKLIEKHPEWEIDSIDDYALIPNKNICHAIKDIR